MRAGFIAEQIEQIDAHDRAGDPERAHSTEDALLHAIVQAIAAGELVPMDEAKALVAVLADDSRTRWKA
jgi:hypothetical protein